MDIIILGHKGMLGQMAYNYFNLKNYNVYTTDLRFEKDNINEWSNFIKSKPKAVILNCIGKIKQKSDEVFELMWSNAILPLQIVNIKCIDQIYIQPSTDCIFNGGKIGPYNLDDNADAMDSYGWSKRLGEIALERKNNCLVVRVSIIGPDYAKTPKGLLGWFLNQPNKSILKGFSNHFWNGITTLEWCIQVEKIINNFETFIEKDVIQLGTEEYYSKYEMLCLFNKVYNTDYTIQPFETESSINRRLQPTIYSKNLLQQLEELYNYTLNRNCQNDY